MYFTWFNVCIPSLHILLPTPGYYEITVLSCDISPGASKSSNSDTYKRSGSKQEIQNYRPISLISIIAKLLENLSRTDSVVSWRNKTCFVWQALSFPDKQVHSRCCGTNDNNAAGGLRPWWSCSGSVYGLSNSIWHGEGLGLVVHLVPSGKWNVEILRELHSAPFCL